MSTTPSTPRSSKRLWRIVLVTAIIASVAGGYAIATRTSQRNEAQDKTQVAKAATKRVGDNGKDLANEVLLACAGTSKEAKAVRAAGLCGKATETKAQITKAIPGAPGANGSNGSNGSNGLPGLPGQTGPTGSPGLSGTNGSNGTNGSTGAAGANGKDGVPGPPGADGKDGTDGKDGATGPQGEPGRSISDAQCGDDGRWTVTYSDGATSDGGVCRASILP